MKYLSFGLLLSAFLLVACGGGANPADVAATVQAEVNATVASIPPEIVTVEVPVEVPVTVEVPVEVPVTIEVPVEVPVTVEVPVEVLITAAVETGAEEPSSDAEEQITPEPETSTSPVDPLAGASSAPLFEEDFLLPDYWEEFADSTASGAIVSEQYVLTVSRTERVNWAFNGRRGSDFYYQGTATISPCKAGDNYGLTFRVVNNFNFYLFGVSCDAQFRLMRYVDGIFETVLPWTPSAAILKFDATNQLGVRATGDQISLFVNEQFLTTVTDGSFAEGRFGMYVGTQLTPELTGVFDDLIAYPITQ